jgi:3-hydroxybutyryl-CoA dehydrogenase
MGKWPIEELASIARAKPFNFEMRPMLDSPSKSTAAVIGGGTMGADVAMVLARAGCLTTVVESGDERRAMLAGHFTRGMTELGYPQRRDCLNAVASLDEVDWPTMDLVIECIPERLDIKTALFADLERRARPDALLTSNSSSFPISAIAAGLKTSSRMLGLHFFMPAHLVPLVEVILGANSAPVHGDTLAAFMRACGMVPVLVKRDLPGFLANRLQHALAREAFSMIDQGVATAEDVDNAVRFGFGFRFLAAGPVLQRDHAGIEVHTAAAATMYPSLSAATVPAKVLLDKVAAGKLGMKTGEGFYRWTQASAGAERRRYDNLLRAGLKLIAAELPPIAPDERDE